MGLYQGGISLASSGASINYTKQDLLDYQKEQARKNIGALGKGDVAQSDWNQNDPTANDYIKNRFGGYMEYTDIESTPEGTFTFREGWVSGEYYTDGLNFLGSENDSCKVVFDGYTYILHRTAVSYTSYGNGALNRRGGIDTGEPLLLENWVDVDGGGSDTWAQLYTTIPGDSHTVAVYEVVGTPVPIPEEYTPTLATKISVEDSVQLKPFNLTTKVNLSPDDMVYGNGIIISYKQGTNTTAYRSLDDGITWEKITLPEGFVNMTFGNGKFVAVPYSTNRDQNIYYSTDALTWSLAVLPTSKDWRNVIFGGGRFIAVGDYDGCAYSEDGVTWIDSSWPDDSDCSGRCGAVYADGKFVFVDGEYAHSSVDGLTWESTELDGTVDVNRVVYGDGKFIAFETKYNNKYLYSSDGKIWQCIESSFTDRICDITYGGNVFVALPYKSTKTIYYSNDGINWIEVETGTTSYVAWNTVRFFNNQFIATSSYGSNIMYSNDGITWRSTKDVLRNTSGATVTSKVYAALGIDKAIEDAIGNTRSDWNQNDPESKDYVKNRPGGYVDGEHRVEAMPDLISVTIDTDGGYEFMSGMTVNALYNSQVVVFDGVEYLCKRDGLSIGGLDKYPFDISEDPGACGTYITCATAGTHTITVYGIEENIVPIDKKFLPDTLAYKYWVTNQINTAIGAAIGGSY